MENKDFSKTKLKNGLTILHERRERPVTTIALATKFGSGYESEKLKGVAHFLEHYLFRGTKKRTSLQISSALEKVGGELNAFTAEQFTIYHVKLPSRYLGLGIDILSDLFLNPAFNPKFFDKEKQIIVEELKMYEDDPKTYVFEKIKSLLYKKPFGLFAIGTRKSLQDMKLKNLVETHGSSYGLENSILSVVGKNSFDDILDLTKKFLAIKRQAEIKKIKISKISKQKIENRRGIGQASMTFGLHIPSLQDKKRYVAEIFNAILAYGMSSKLAQEIREKRGLAYSVKGFLDQSSDYGYLVIYVGTEKSKVQKCKEIILKEIKKLRQLKKKELEEAKEKLIGNYTVQNEDSRNVAFTLTAEQLAGSAEEFYDYEEKIKQIKLQEVRNFAKIKNYSFAALLPE